MRRLLLTGLLLSPTANANEHLIIGQACDKTECVEIIIDHNPDAMFRSAATQKKGSGQNRFIEIISATTGQGINAIRSVFSGIRQTVIASGYHTFKGELSGPAGTVTVAYNFQNGAWSVSGGGGIPSQHTHIK